MKTGDRKSFGLLLSGFILLLGTINATTLASAETVQIAGSRPYSIVLPTGYAAARPAPLVILLHSYGGSGEQMVNYLQFTAAANSNKIIYVAPDGTKDGDGKKFWNATPGCCNFGGSKINDTHYISDIITQVESSYAIDKNRVFVIGHSNGGFMSQNVGCNLSDQVAGIVSIAGAQYADASTCSPSDPINVLQIHGTLDLTVPYSGGSLGLSQFPGALQTIHIWAEKDQCNTKDIASSQNLSLVSQKSLPDTKIISFENCALGSAVELWSIDGAPHVPIWNSSFMPAVINWLMKHPKPTQVVPTPTPTPSTTPTPKPTPTPKKVTKVIPKKVVVKPTPRR